MSKALLGGAVPHSVLASAIIALAQHENVQLYTVVLTPGQNIPLEFLDFRKFLEFLTLSHFFRLFFSPYSSSRFSSRFIPYSSSSLLVIFLLTLY